MILCALLIPISAISGSCNSYELNNIKLDIEQKKQTLSLRSYNFNFLSQVKMDLLREKNILQSCEKKINNDLSDITKILQNPKTVSLTEQQNIKIIQRKTLEDFQLIQNCIFQINSLIVLTKDRLNYAKDYSDYRNQKKSFIQLIQMGNFNKPTLKSTQEVFPITYQGYIEHPKTFIFSFLGLISLSFATLYLLKKITHKNEAAYFFYDKTKYVLFFLYPFAGLFIYIQHETNFWLASLNLVD